MIEIIKQLDTLLFLTINKALINSPFDIIMPFITQFKNSIVALAVLSLYILYKKRLKGLEMIIAIVIAVILADQISSQFVKSFFARPRPCAVMENVRLLLWCNSSYSFTSSHAATTMAGGIVFYLYYRTALSLLLMFTVVTLIGISRIYIGVHYPFDILGGWLVGFLCGFLTYKIFRKLPFLG